jgi:hypothetical protein
LRSNKEAAVARAARGSFEVKITRFDMPVGPRRGELEIGSNFSVNSWLAGMLERAWWQESLSGPLKPKRFCLPKTEPLTAHSN